MPRKRALPLVAICGRPNVGKSTLFNRILGKQRAIVHAEEGITRDRFYATAEWQGRKFRLVDTGGIMENPVDPVSQKMQVQVRAALDEADVILFVIDGQQELTRIDHLICDDLRRYGKPVVLAVNKLDNPAMEMRRFEFYALGLGEPRPISSGHGLGIEDLLEAVAAHLRDAGPRVEIQAEDQPSAVIKVAIVGKPNVGKSSFVNAILNTDRTIVDERPGTTRDAIDIEFHWKGREYLLIDTAGLRKKAGIKKPVEHYSVSRSLRAVRRADVCMVMIDAVEGITEQDKRILGYAMEQGTALVIAWSKWDMVENKEKRFKALDGDIDLHMPQIKFVPYFTLSNLTRRRIFTSFEYINRVAAAAEKRISTAELNKFIEEVRSLHIPPTQKGKAARIYYATQASVKPTVFVLFVNQKRLFHFSYLRFIENQFRERYGFEGVPIRLELREGKAPKE